MAESDIVAQLTQLTALVNQRFDRLESQIAHLSQPLNPPAAQTTDTQIRLAQLEQQMQQLTQRVLYLESLLSAGSVSRVEVIVEDEEMEDQPDEILWEFMEPGERQ